MAKQENLYIRLITVLRGQGTRKLLGDMKLLKSTFRAVFRTTAVVAFFMAIRSIGKAIQDVIQKTRQLISENTKLQFSSTQAAAIMASGGKETIENFKGIIEAARKMSTETMFSANKISEGLVRGAMAGFQLKQNIAIVTRTLQMATVAGVDFRSSMSGVIGVTRAFGVNIKQLPQYVDVMTAAFTKANMTFTDFITAMKYVAPVAVAAFGSAKQTFIDTTAALMTLSNVGLDASKSGIYLRGTILKLMGATNKVSTAFAKYGINLYEGKGKAKEYMNTMMAGQKVMSDYYDKITELKKKQFELVLAGKDGTAEYKNIQKELKAAGKKLAEYSSGIKVVQDQFKMAGGKLKPLSEILKMVKETMPTGVLTKIFGARGGAGIATLLTKFPDFQKNLKTLNEVWEKSKKGKSILHDIFVTMLNTAMVKWIEIKNTIWSIFSVIIQAGLKSAAPLLDVILEGVKKIYNIVDANKGVFDKIFKTIVDSYIPEIKKFFNSDLPKLVKKINIFSPKWKTQLYESVLNKKTGKFEAKPTQTLTGQTPGERLFALARSLSSYMISSFLSLIRNHKQDFNNIGQWLALGMGAALKTMYGKFIEVGMWIATGVIQYLISQFPILGKFTDTGRQAEGLKGEINTLKGTELIAKILSPFTGKKIESKVIASAEKRIGTINDMIKILKSPKKMGEYYTTNEVIYKKYKPLEQELGVNMGLSKSVDKQIKNLAPQIYNNAHILDDKTVTTFENINGVLTKIVSYMSMIDGKLKKVGEYRDPVSKR